MFGSTSFLLGARTSSGVSTGRPSGSANRKHKYSTGGVRPVVSHESEEPRRSNTPGSFLGKRSQHPRQSPLVGEGDRRLASSRPAALSVSEGAIGIPLLFLCHYCRGGSQVVLRIVITPDPPKTPASPLTQRGGLDLEEVPSSPPPFLCFEIQNKR